jgi:hypothetical protein
MGDAIKVRILEDGTIKIETDPISPANHLSAEQLVDAISRLAGGEVTTTKKHSHTHTHVKHTQDQGHGH